MTLFRHFLNLLFPIHCVLCNKTDTYLCNECSQNIDHPFGILDGIISVFSYQDPRIKHLLWRLKFKGTFAIAETFGNYLYDAIMEELSDTLFFDGGVEKILLIPIPLSKHRLRDRGFNQAERLANALYKCGPRLFVVHTNILIRTKDTPAQSTIHKRTERKNNVRNCFSISKMSDVLPYKKSLVIIIDDIATTGATIYEAQKVLKRAGFKKIIGLTVAH